MPPTLLCPICYESFDDQERIPVLLDQCGHSFCKSCLKAGGGSISRCPQCRQPITKSTSDLKTNLALIHAITLNVDKIASESAVFDDDDVSYATILSSMAPDVRDAVLQKLQASGFNTAR